MDPNNNELPGDMNVKNKLSLSDEINLLNNNYTYLNETGNIKDINSIFNNIPRSLNNEKYSYNNLKTDNSLLSKIKS